MKDGVRKSVHGVSYVEVLPQRPLLELVDCYWELRTQQTLQDDFVLHVLPDACVNILLNRLEPTIAGITALQTEYKALNLGRRFHYVGIQLYPGVWQSPEDKPVDHFVGEPYRGRLPLVDAAQRVGDLESLDTVGILSSLVAWLIEASVIAPNPTTLAILRRLDEIRTVADMASVAELSPRQLQRRLKQTTGLRPHDLLKILRIQQSFRKDVLLSFADQAHFIRSFRSLTGHTPSQFSKTFDV